MTRKTGLYIGPDLAAVLDARGAGRDGESLSGLVNRIGDRYGELVRRSTPGLAPAEWALIFDALNGILLAPASHVALLYAEIEDHIRLNDAGRKWSLTHEQATALIERLRAATYAESLAVVDAAERFWATCTDGSVQDGIARLALPIRKDPPDTLGSFMADP